MIDNSDVLNEGFTPLRRAPTEPVSIGNKRGTKGNNSRINSFHGEAMSREQRSKEQALFETSTWSILEKSRGRRLSRGNSFIGDNTFKNNSAPGSPSANRKKNLSADAVIAGIENLDIAKNSDKAIAVVDPFTTGAHIAAGVCQLGYKCVRILAIWDSPVASLIQEGVDVDYDVTIQHNDVLDDQNKAINDTITQLNNLPYEIAAVIPGAETGVELADKLSHRMKLRSNGEDGSMARRNKYHMGEKVRQAGVRAVKQRFCKKETELLEFLNDLSSNLKSKGMKFKCVVKPVESAGTDDVFLCDTIDEAVTGFHKIIGKKNGLGIYNDGVLVQEFLKGSEYVVDKVSRNGVHKIVAIWQYVKRPINGADFVYFGMKLIDPNTEQSQEMIKYSDEVLNALGIREGPSHMEVMYCADGPCLVEVGSRCHGGEGTWLPVAQECIGYTMVSVTLDVYTNGKLFDKIEKNTFPKLKAGRDVDVVNRHAGVVRGFPGEKILKQMDSYRAHSWEVKVGEFIPLTINCFTRPGCFQFVADTEEEADKDLEFLHSLEDLQLIDYTVQCPTAPTYGSVVVVDPFSTGANLAAEVVKMGYKLILVFSEVDSPVAKMTGSDDANMGDSTSKSIYHDARSKNDTNALALTIKAIENAVEDNRSTLMAILPGAETGVELADVLSKKMQCRSNGHENSEIRRNKAKMQEAVRRSGLRAVKQYLCRNEDDVIEFFQSLGVEAKCVIKPNMSAGSDCVFKCNNVNEAIAGFQEINGQSNGLGQVNDGALCQEYLHGTEYVVDGVSRDGIYKVTAIWEYDKRSVNNANFVYYGMKLISPQSDRGRALIEYARGVNRAVGVVQGPSHMEVMYCADGPCLVEVGSRCHGGEGTWLPVAQECIGYTQVSVTLDAYLRPDRYDLLPMEPQVLLHSGCEIFLVSTHNGILKGIPGLSKIRSLSSFRRLEMQIQSGMKMVPTIDCFSRPGSIQLVAHSDEALVNDYEYVRTLEKKTGEDFLFELV